MLNFNFISKQFDELLTDNSKKKYVITIGILIVILLFLIGLIISFSLSQNTNSNNNVASISPTKTPLPTPLLSPIIPTSPPTPIPEPNDIFIDGIPVNDFKEDSTIDPNGDLLISDNEDYQIIFNESNQKFIIKLLADDFESTQLIAEQQLLEILGIDELNICRLYIEEEVSVSAQNEYAGKVFPFSRCIHPDN